MTKIKNKLLVVLSALLIFSLAFSLSLATPTTIKASEENTVTPTVNVTTILMDEGASVRTETSDGISSGIRFTMYINAEYYAGLTNPVVGMYIARATDATEDDMKSGTLPEKYQHVVATYDLAGDAAETVEDTLSFNAVIFNIPEEEFGTALIANGYIVADGAEVEYAVNPQTRSIAQVASIAIANGMDDEVLFYYVDTALALSGETFGFATETVTLNRYLDEGKTADLELNIPLEMVAIVSSTDPNVATVDANGVVTRGTKVGTTTIKAQLGSAEVTATVTVTAEKPEIYTVDENYNKEIEYYDGWSHFGDFDKAGESANFVGGYTGKAVKIKYVGEGRGYTVENNYSLTELNAIAQDYSTVSFWIAINRNEKSVGFNNSSSMKEGVLNKTLGLNWDNGYKFRADEANKVFGSEKWYKFVITIDQYIDLVTDDEGNVRDVCPITTVWNGDSTVVYLYFGDISFGNELVHQGYAVKDKLDNSKVYMYDGWGTYRFEYVAAGAEEIADFTGDYKGNAVKRAIATNTGWRFVNPYSLDQLNNMKENNIYKNVSFYIALDGITAGVVGFNATVSNMADSSEIGKKYFQVDSTSTSQLILKHWYKVTVSLDEYITLVTDSATNTAKNYCTFMSTFCEAVTGSGIFYLSDIFFE